LCCWMEEEEAKRKRDEVFIPRSWLLLPSLPLVVV
jgi:hypothetical protein